MVVLCLMTTSAERVEDPSEDLSHPGIYVANDDGNNSTWSAGGGDGGFITGWRWQQRYRAGSIARGVEERHLQGWGARGLGCHAPTSS